MSESVSGRVGFTVRRWLGHSQVSGDQGDEQTQKWVFFENDVLDSDAETPPM